MQNAVVSLIVLAAVGYLLACGWRVVSSQRQAGCGGCQGGTTCGAGDSQSPSSFVDLELPDDNGRPSLREDNAATALPDADAGQG